MIRRALRAARAAGSRLLAAHPVLPDDTPAARLALALTALFAAGLLAALAGLIVSRYQVKAYSDPINWLMYARDFASQFRSSPYPPGYPLFLSAALRVAGPYRIFLANLPLLLLAFACGAALCYRMLRGDGVSRAAAAFGALATLCVFAGLDVELLFLLVNPYRDPLAIALTLGSFLLLIAAVRGEAPRPSLAAVAGVLLGFAAGTRETSILAMPAMFLYGLAAWGFDRRVPFWKTALLFGAGCGAGLAPMLWQTYLQSGQMLMPAQSAQRGAVLPGFYVDTHAATRYYAWLYYREDVGRLLVAGAALGAVFGAAKRNRILLLLVLPAAVTLAVFYSYYESFVRRYYYTVSALAAPIAAYGCASLVLLVQARLRWRGAQAAVQAAAAAACLAWVGLRIHHGAPAPGPAFQAPQAERLAAAFGPLVDARTIVLSPRPLSDMLRHFTPATSLPLEKLCHSGALNVPNVREEVEGWLKDGRDVLAVDLTGENQPPGRDVRILSGVYEPVFVRSFRTDDFNLRDLLGAGVLALYRVTPQTQTVSVASLAVPGRGAVLRLDGGLLWPADTARKQARLFLDGAPVLERVEDGANYVRVPDAAADRGTVDLRLESDAPIGSRLFCEVIGRDEPIVIPLGEEAIPNHRRFIRLQPGTPRSHDAGVILVRDRAEILCPVLWASNDLAIAQADLRSLGKGTPQPLLATLSQGGASVERKVPQDRRGYALVLPLQPPPGGAECPVELTVKLLAEGELLAALTADGSDLIEIASLTVHRVPLHDSFHLAVADRAAGVLLSQGVYRREDDSEKRAFQWTDGQAAALVYMRPPSNAEARLRVVYSDRYCPARRRPLELQAAFNGHPVPVTSEKAGDLTVACGQIPAASFAGTRNRLELTCPPWVPSQESPTRDSRRLGVMLYEIRVGP